MNYFWAFYLNVILYFGLEIIAFKYEIPELSEWSDGFGIVAIGVVCFWIVRKLLTVK